MLFPIRASDNMLRLDERTSKVPYFGDEEGLSSEADSKCHGRRTLGSKRRRFSLMSSLQHIPTFSTQAHELPSPCESSIIEGGAV